MPKVDLAHYEGREQAYVKHCLLEEYLPEWAFKVGSKWDSLVYVDGFAGPWQTTDPGYADSSFGLAINVLRHCQSGLYDQGKPLKMVTILVEKNKSRFARLRVFAQENTTPTFPVHALHGAFVDKIPEIDKLITRAAPHPFRFVFLDPEGWADIPMERLLPLLKDRSCEVLINLMTKHIHRFLQQDDRASSYHNLFGREGVLELLQSAAREEQVDLAVKEYCRSLQMLCGFEYVSSAVILEPNEQKIRYFLVYASHHPRGVEVFKAAEMKAARTQEAIRDEKRIQKTGQPGFIFDEDSPISTFTHGLYQRYAKRARAKVVEALWRSAPKETIPYENLFCEAMAFPLVTPEDLIDWLKDMEPNIEIRLAGPRRRKLSPLKEDQIIVINRERLR
jgi:three-Cys-motif partner protein